MNPPRIPRAAAVAAMAAGASAVGPPIGLLWAWLAPPVHGAMALTRAGERVQAYLGDEAEHFFVAPFMLLGLLGVVAMVAATVAWQWRAHRGPGMLAGLSVGLVGAAVLTVLVGAQLVHRRYGATDIESAPLTPQHRVHYFTEAPPVFFGPGPAQIAATLLSSAALAALVYALCATWAVRDDLGGYPPAGNAMLTGPRMSAPAGAVTADDGVTPCR